MDKAQKEELINLFFALAVAGIIVLLVVFFIQTPRKVEISKALENINDIYLRSCIEDYSNANAVDFTYEIKKLECLPEISARRQTQQVQDLSGIEQFQYLKELSLPNSRLKTLEPLSHLKRLEKLNLAASQIIDIRPLKGLKNLRSLNLSSNSVIITEEFTKFEELYLLNLSNNGIRDLSELQFCKNIQSLDLSKNKITDIAALSNLDKLEFLNLSNNQIKDVTPLSKLVTKRLLLKENVIQNGVELLFSSLGSTISNDEFQALINLEANNKIDCEQVTKLKTRLVNYKSIKIIEPKSCIEKPTKRRYYRYRPKKKFWLFRIF